MATIVIQAGHCHRRTGSTGTRAATGFTEQQFTWPVANAAAQLLAADGHRARVILADPPSTGDYAGDAFVAVHADGNNNPTVHGASVGYRTDQGKALAAAWKAAYRALGWSSGFRGDNYTAALSGYYGCKRAVDQGNRRACIIEAGFLTNPAEAAHLSSPAGQDRCAQAIRRAVNAMFGVASTTPDVQEDPIVPELEIIKAFDRYLGEDDDGRLPSDHELQLHAWYAAVHGIAKAVLNIARSDEAELRRRIVTDEDPERRHAPGDIVAYRLAEIEKRLDSQAREQARGFADVARQITGLTFVHVDTYAADQRTADEIHASIRKDVADLEAVVVKGFERVDTRINWSHAVIGVALLGGVVAGIARLAGLS